MALTENEANVISECSFQLKRLAELTSNPAEKVLFETMVRKLVSLTAGNLSMSEIGLLRNGSYLEAIKELRNRSQLGLKEAKDIVDQYVKNAGIIVGCSR